MLRKNCGRLKCFGLVCRGFTQDKGVESVKRLFLDLAGTLADLRKGICHAYEYALNDLGYTLPDTRSRLFSAPVLDTLVDVWGLEPRKAKETEKVFWQYYAQKGLYESYMPQEVSAMLEHLSKQNIALYAVSSLQYGCTERLLAYHDAAKYFSGFFDAAADGTCSSKEDILSAAMEHENITSSEIVFVGASRHSAAAAEFLGIDFVRADCCGMYPADSDTQNNGTDGLEKLLLALNSTAESLLKIG